MQAGALHTCVVHPGITHWVVSPLEHTHSCNDTVFEINIFFLRKHHKRSPLCPYLWSQSGTAWVQQSRRWPAEESLQLQVQNAPHTAPSSSGLVRLVWSRSDRLSPLFIHLAALLLRRQRWRQQPSHDAAAWLKELGNCAICGGTRRCWFIGGGVKGILCLGSVMDVLEITSPCFSGHEPLVIQTMTYAMQWLRGRRLGGRRGDRGQQ